MTIDPETLPYRPCAGMMVLNRDGLVFVGRRIDTTLEAWQMPQGGIDEGEDTQEAALRELEEEIGTRDVAILGRSHDWLYYDLPPDLIGRAWGGRYRGQKQIWFAMRLIAGDDAIRLDTTHPEFDAWRWAALDELPGLAIPFKRPLYEQVVALFRPYAKPEGGR